jgi:hypothetical protein
LLALCSCKKFVSLLNQDQKIRTNSYIELKEYVGGKVPYETHRMGLTRKLLILCVWFWSEFQIPVPKSLRSGIFCRNLVHGYCDLTEVPHYCDVTDCTQELVRLQ